MMMDGVCLHITEMVVAFTLYKKWIQLKSTHLVFEVSQRILYYWPDPVPMEENGACQLQPVYFVQKYPIFKLEMLQWGHCPWNKRKIIIHVYLHYLNTVGTQSVK